MSDMDYLGDMLEDAQRSASYHEKRGVYAEVLWYRFMLFGRAAIAIGEIGKGYKKLYRISIKIGFESPGEQTSAQSFYVWSAEAPESDDLKAIHRWWNEKKEELG